MVCKLGSSSWYLQRDLGGIGLHFSPLAAICWRARPMGLRFPTMPAASCPTSCLMGPRPGASATPSGRRWRSACGRPSRAGTSTPGEISITGAEWGAGGGGGGRAVLGQDALSLHGLLGALACLLVLCRVCLTEAESRGHMSGSAAHVRVSLPAPVPCGFHSFQRSWRQGALSVAPFPATGRGLPRRVMTGSLSFLFLSIGGDDWVTMGGWPI